MRFSALFCLLSLAFVPALAQENANKATRPFIKEYQYDTVDIAPQFPGGEKAMILFLHEKLKNIDLKDKPEGISYLNFIVTKEGEIQDIRVLKSLEPTLDQAAIEVVKQMPRWTPASQKGQIIDSRRTIPVLFSNKQSSKKVKHKTKR